MDVGQLITVEPNPTQQMLDSTQLNPLCIAVFDRTQWEIIYVL